MKRQQIVFVLVVAMLCVAATAITHEGPGRSVNAFMAGQTIYVGHVDIWNNGRKIILDENGIEFDSGSMLQVEINMEGDWFVKDLQVQAGFEPIPVKKAPPEERRICTNVRVRQPGRPIRLFQARRLCHR